MGLALWTKPLALRQLRQRRVQAPHVVPHVAGVAKNDLVLALATVASLAPHGVVVLEESVLVSVFQRFPLERPYPHPANRARVLLLQPLLDAVPVKPVPTRIQLPAPLRPGTGEVLEANQALLSRHSLSRFPRLLLSLLSLLCPLGLGKARLDLVKPILSPVVRVEVSHLLWRLAGQEQRQREAALRLEQEQRQKRKRQAAQVEMADR